MMNEIYPLTVVLDRYNGTYSGGKWTAWNLRVDCVPIAIMSDDVACCEFWECYSNDYCVGIGNTPDEAIESLELKLKLAAGEFVLDYNDKMPF